MAIRPLGVILALALGAACGSDDGTGPGSSDEFSAQIDGASFVAVEGFSTFAQLSGGLFILRGTNADGDQLGFTWPDGGTGTYTIGVTPGTMNADYSDGGTFWAAEASFGGSGTVTVTSRTSSRVAGTFNFVLVPDAFTGQTGTRTVTQGKFNLEY
jgi:hypothetical protein